MVETKNIKIRCFDERCRKFGAEYLYFKFHTKIANRTYSFVSFFCPFHQYMDIDRTWWDFSKIYRMCELFESGINYKKATEILNKDFNINLCGKSTSKGYKGSLVKKFEHMKENSIDWSSYNNDEKLIQDTIILFKTLKEKKNRYIHLKEKH